MTTNADARGSRSGVVYRPDFAPEALAPLAASVDVTAIDELWLWEDCFLQGAVAQAAVALASTQTLVVGIGVMPAPLRSVVATAMEVATLARMFPGRVKVGIGHGVQSWMRQSGVAVDSPLTLLREYVHALRSLLAGEEVSVEGRYVTLNDIRLQWFPVEPVPVLIGGTGPKTLALAGEIADGVILDCQHTVQSVRDALGHVAKGRRDRGSTPFTTVMYVVCAPGPDAEAMLSTEARKWAVSATGDFGVGGSTEQIRGGTDAYRAAGVDTVVFQPLGSEIEFPAFTSAIDAACQSGNP